MGPCEARRWPAGPGRAEGPLASRLQQAVVLRASLIPAALQGSFGWTSPLTGQALSESRPLESLSQWGRRRRETDPRSVGPKDRSLVWGSRWSYLGVPHPWLVEPADAQARPEHRLGTALMRGLPLRAGPTEASVSPSWSGRWAGLWPQDLQRKRERATVTTTLPRDFGTRGLSVTAHLIFIQVLVTFYLFATVVPFERAEVEWASAEPHSLWGSSRSWARGLRALLAGVQGVGRRRGAVPTCRDRGSVGTKL